MADEDRSGESEENLAVGDTPSGNPPFLIYKKRLYILSKKAPDLGRADEGGRRPPRPLEVQARRTPGQRVPARMHATGRGDQGAGTKGQAAAGRARGPMVRRRTRPFIKGTYRVYSSRFPHLAPSDRKKYRKRIPRTEE